MEAISDIERVSAELAIRNLIARIFLLTDTAPDLSDYQHCFTEDAVWERRGHDQAISPVGHLGSRAEGRAAIVADRMAVRASGATGPTSGSWHMTTNVLVSLTGPGTARAWTAWIYVVPDGAGGEKVGRAGYYQDDFRCTDGVWRLSHRQYSIGKPPSDISPKG
jgi:hypothetical protein